MGNNEVIIDGVNVAECEFCSVDWRNSRVCEISSISMNYNHFCNENPNCYFKQLQRAKAELEQYKKSKQASYEAMQREWQGTVHLLREVQAEKQEKVLKMAEAEVEIEKLQAENEKLKKEIKNLNFYIDSYRQVWEVDKYRKAFEEIKEFIKNDCKKCTAECDCVIDDEYCPNYAIKDKIDKVLKIE